jgi:nucleotide-binding universal stress UspA family protein
MQVLCAIGKQDGAEMIRRTREVIGSEHELHLLHVLDSGPRRTMQEYLFGPGQLRRTPPAELITSLDAAEQAAAEAALEEARQAAEQAGFRVQTEIQPEIEPGKPEQIIVRAAHLWGCQLIVIRASEGLEGRPLIGPQSVGHTARFVLDHAPCDVLFLREPVTGLHEHSKSSDMT